MPIQIAPQDARSVYTQALVAVYRERVAPLNFGRSFFPTVEADTLEVSIEVVRDSEKIAVDVLRGTNGNRNTFSRSSMKAFIPPYFREYFDQTDLDMYDRVFGSANASISESTIAALVETVAMKYGKLQDKIERAYEKQCWDTLLTGIVTLNSGDNIDFKRKAASLVDGTAAGLTWATASNDALGQLAAGADFVRNTGKARGGTMNLILGSEAFEALFSNQKLLSQADLRRINLVDLNSPQANAAGGTYHGQISSGNYIFNVWTYNEVYTDASGNQQSYMDPKKIIILPETTNFKLAFGAVPMLQETGNPAFPQAIQAKQGAFVFGDYVDARAHSHIFDIQSAGVPIPVAVDQIYTRQVIAS
jgi:hypothetical protein